MQRAGAVATEPIHAGTRRRVVARVGRERGLKLIFDPLRTLLFLLIIVTISRVHLHYSILAKFRPVLLLSFLAVGYAFLYPRSLAKSNVLRWWPMQMVALIAVLACLSVPFGISLGNSALFIIDDFGKTVAMAFLVALCVRDARDLYTMVWAYVASCGILSYFAVFVFQLVPGSGDTTRLAELYTYDSNDLGVILMIGLALNLLLMFVDRGLKRWLLLVNLVAIAAAMARSGSRGGFLGLVAVALSGLAFINGVPFARRASILAVGLAALAFAAPAGYWRQMSTILAPKQDYNYTYVDGRSALMKRGFGYMMDRPLFGIGIWNFAKAECSISPKIALNPQAGVRCIAPHNSVVQAAAELGIPGLVSWISLVFGLILGPLRLRRRLPDWRRGTSAQRFLYAGLGLFPVAICGFAVSSFFVTFAFAAPIYLMAALTTGLYIAIANERTGAGGVTGGVASAPNRAAAGWRVARSAQAFSVFHKPLESAG
jgi:O-antigen ligase